MTNIVSIKRVNKNQYTPLKELLTELEKGEAVSFVAIAMMNDERLCVYTCDTEPERRTHRVGMAQTLVQHLVDEILSE